MRASILTRQSASGSRVRPSNRHSGQNRLYRCPHPDPDQPNSRLAHMHPTSPAHAMLADLLRCYSAGHDEIAAQINCHNRERTAVTDRMINIVASMRLLYEEILGLPSKKILSNFFPLNFIRLRAKYPGAFP